MPGEAKAMCNRFLRESEMNRKRAPWLACALAAGIVLLVTACEEQETPEAETAEAAQRAPAAADPSDWCAGHGLPESMCTKCNPSLLDHYQSSGDWCAEHGYPESACPLCNPMPPPSDTEEASIVAPGTQVRLRSPAVERAAGIETVPAAAAAIGHEVEATARVDFDRNAMADVRSAVPGIVREVSVDLGRRVAEGEALFTVESARVGDLRARRGAALQRVEAARAHLARRRQLHEGAVASRRQLDLAQQEFEAAAAELRSIDQSLRVSGASAEGRTGRFTLHAPIAGTVIRRPGLVGGAAGESNSLATIADTSRMWVLIDLPEWDAAGVRRGQQVEVRVDGVEGRTFAGKVTWIASEVDPRTRSVAARAELRNPDGLLRAGQFARATIHVAAPEDAVTVPLGSVQRVGDESILFVRTKAGLYEPRVVSPGRSDGRRVQVAGALREGEAVVTTGAFLLRTELSRESIGAGCCEVDGPEGT
ncbi:MAG: efflux transporter periplasmic adaptor subunit [Deltaproteobacteria bacterium]|nr:efflux transporter periplasmic adaptor subunit [Deltaproteobacteria bacterium]